MPKMTDDELLSVLEAESDAAEAFNLQIAEGRVQALKDYARLPYGNEEEGRSSVISSDVFDAVEGMLPELIDVFASTEEAVRFDPVGPEDVEGAQQATDACNYVFYKQNNGFFVLYTAAKDALLLKTGAVKWWWEERRTPTFTTYKNATDMSLAMMELQDPTFEILEKDPQPPELGPNDMPQPPMFTVKTKTVAKKGRVRVANIPPDELLVSTRHAMPMFEDASYVAHVCEKSLSDLLEMGYDVTIEDVKAAKIDTIEESSDKQLRNNLNQQFWEQDDRTDDAMTRGWYREEYVLVDYDGDGIAERRRVCRLGKKILSKDECSHVQIAAWAPYLQTHQYYGISVAELVSEFQRANTEIWRQSLDNAYLANNQETIVLANRNDGAPMANLDDLLNRKPGGVIREYQANAIRPMVERWAGLEVAPLTEMMASMKENRTGYTRYSQGLDGQSLNQTAHGIQQIMNASQKRMKLMARIMAEGLVAPMFKGIFKTLSDYCMDTLSFRLHNKFVQYDPQNWRDGYDMTINVGLGAGDKQQQLSMLGTIEAAQAAVIQGGGMGTLVDSQRIYNLQKRKAELAGFKDAGEFWVDPSSIPPKPPAEPPPDPNVLKTQMQIQADGQKTQAMQAHEANKMTAEQAFQADQAERDRQLQFALKQIELAAKQPEPQDSQETQDDAKENETMVMIANALQILATATLAPKRIVRDEAGRPVGVEAVMPEPKMMQ